jgi:hypothetical protein
LIYYEKSMINRTIFITQYEDQYFFIYLSTLKFIDSSKNEI